MKKVLFSSLLLLLSALISTPVSTAEISKKEMIDNVYVSFVMSSTYINSREEAQYIYKITKKEARRYGFQTSMVLSQQFRESTFNSKAVSYKDARGIGQVIHSKWTWYHKYNKIIDKEYDLHDTKKGVQAQVLILKKFYIWEKDMSKALNRYSGHASNYDKKVFKYMNQMNQKIKKIREM